MSPGRAVPALLVAAALGGAGWWLAAERGTDGGEVEASLSVWETLGGGDTAGYARAVEPRTFRFPEDHGAHPDFRTEWWYFTGNLEGPAGERFGYQLTFFRSALGPDRPAPAGSDAEPSGWRTRQAWMAHFALTDVEGASFQAFERFERGALGLAGATREEGADTFGASGGAPALRVWTGPWEVRSAGPDSVFPLRVRAADGPVALEVELAPEKGIVLQGEGGLSPKGPQEGNASYYYSVPRLRTVGTVRTARGAFRVTGSSWLDREWSTSVLPEGVVGWDWFALQLEDGRDVMVYALRREDGGLTAFSDGVVVGVEGEPRPLSRDDFRIEVVDSWASPLDGAVYPSGWRVRVPAEGLDLRVEPVLEDQELDLAFRYWEGAVDVAPWKGSGGPRGRGYVELTGYAGAEPPGR